MQTVTLELLRHGPRHNQLLSPLTEYLALCGNHQAVTIHVPFEHSQFLHRLRALEYRNEKERLFHLQETADLLGQILAKVPGLTSELAKDASERLTHFRLILSSSELALLPFELALAPNGFPGAGQSLTLQPQLPLCLTREVRRAGDDTIKWPSEPKILFIAASPPGVGPVPLESHLLALRKAIAPWVRFARDEAELRSKIAEHLVVLPQATVDLIHEKCSSESFTHIHVLAHGREYPNTDDRRFGLALHHRADPEGEAHIISGLELATLLRSCKRPDGRQLATPAVVTIASCNSAHVGTVVGAGASIAHDLHDADIPMVVASQFPLSFPGSVLMTEILYEGLLWGYDPRPLLNDLRRQLRARVPQTHDWASLVAYLALPGGFEEELTRIQVERAQASVEAALDYADKTVEQFSSRRLQRNEPIPDPTKKEALLDSADRKIKAATKRLRDLHHPDLPKDSPINGLLASTHKRHAEILFNYAKLTPEGPRKEKYQNDSIEMLRDAKEDYWTSFEQNRSNIWAIVQYLSISIVLRTGVESPEQRQNEDFRLLSLFNFCMVLSQMDLHHEQRRTWALGNLIELTLLNWNFSTPPVALTKEGITYAEQLVKIEGLNSFAVFSTRRQILRYVEWFSEVNSALKPLTSFAEQIFEALCRPPV